eukprot:CAMPEP_0180667298 /NCGR_PEP_ID=MMETSP1037_2-20121125/62304_1 /TAXON_ID=632150 /ORGANISM="Azadinium spinosum, Strain 3D9" /LENGTH=98 /DNA_ID=CAMNT_0022695925 /DNA_START=96 /DNA_END=390 /DNA_ORIENTATION=+
MHSVGGALAAEELPACGLGACPEEVAAANHGPARACSAPARVTRPGEVCKALRGELRDLGIDSAARASRNGVWERFGSVATAQAVLARFCGSHSSSAT